LACSVAHKCRPLSRERAPSPTVHPAVRALMSSPGVRVHSLDSCLCVREERFPLMAVFQYATTTHSGATLPQGGRKRKHLISGGKGQRNAVADNQKTTREPETARADNEARKGEDGIGPHHRSLNQVRPAYHLFRREGSTLSRVREICWKVRALWLRMLLEMGGDWVRCRYLTSACPHSACAN